MMSAISNNFHITNQRYKITVNSVKIYSAVDVPSEHKLLLAKVYCWQMSIVSKSLLLIKEIKEMKSEKIRNKLKDFNAQKEIEDTIDNNIEIICLKQENHVEDQWESFANVTKRGYEGQTLTE